MPRLQEIQVDSFRLDYLGIPVQVAERIKMVETIDSICGDDAREIFSTGQCVLAMALSWLSRLRDK